MVEKETPFVVPEARDDESIRKSSTLNSMFIGTTISKPNVDSIISAVATILHSQMLEVTTRDDSLIYACVGFGTR